ncbi:MAG: alkaline phosphatase family protein [Myxococcota bacterium]|nr:alkaline phosphatase family protein [Myxococcota bacterium]
MGRAARRLGIALGIGLALLAAGVGWLALRHLPLFDDQAPARLDRRPPGVHRPAERRVVLVSVDGLAPRVLAATPTPTLERLADEGLRAEVARTVVPSITMTSHVSMLSGVPPEVHGVTFNRYQPWSAIPVPTLFSRCAEAGLRCGLFAGKRKFAHLAEAEPGVERYRWAPDAAAVLAEAARYAAERDPDLLVVHLAEVDLAGHRAGWDGPVQRAALTGVDALLGRFVARLCAGAERPLAVLVTSDHGGHGTNHGTGRPEDVRIPWILWGDGIAPGTLPEVSTLDTAPTLAALLDLPPEQAWVGTARLPATARVASTPSRCADPSLAAR